MQYLLLVNRTKILTVHYKETLKPTKISDYSLKKLKLKFQNSLDEKTKTN